MIFYNFLRIIIPILILWRNLILHQHQKYKHDAFSSLRYIVFHSGHTFCNCIIECMKDPSFSFVSVLLLQQRLEYNFILGEQVPWTSMNEILKLHQSYLQPSYLSSWLETENWDQKFVAETLVGAKSKLKFGTL